MQIVFEPQNFGVYQLCNDHSLILTFLPTNTQRNISA